MISWWRRHWRLGLALIVIGLALIVLIILYILKKKKEAEELKTQLMIMKASSRVAGLEADKKARQIELIKNKEEATKVKAEIIEAKREAVAYIKEVDKMSDVEVLQEFKKLGY